MKTVISCIAVSVITAIAIAGAIRLRDAGQFEQAAASDQLMQAGEILRTIDRAKVATAQEDEFLLLVLGNVVVASRIPHKVSELYGPGLFGLCAVLARRQNPREFGAKAPANIVALANGYLDRAQLAVSKDGKRLCTNT